MLPGHRVAPAPVRPDQRADQAVTRPRASAKVRFAVYTVAIWAVGVGVSLMVEGDLGVAPNDVLNTGLGDTVGLGVGTAAWLTGVVAMALAWVLGRRPLVATIVGSVVVGLSINGMLALLPTPEHLAARLGFLALGLAVVWSAITGVVAADVGAGPLELVMLGLMDRGISIRTARWGIELTLLLLGLALGGAAGLGTAVFALGTGPVLAVTLPRAAARLGTQLSQPTDVAAAGV
jgi:uncharacterized membrane protein YczE